MLFFLLPPSIRKKIGPRIQIGLGLTCVALGIATSARIALVAGVVLALWGLVGTVSQARHGFRRHDAHGVGVR